MKYEQGYENEWIQPVMKGYRLGCCDCGLVHDMDFRIVSGRVQFKVKRNNRATGQKRRYKKIKH